jgi:16S rRNA (guanine966-N2)-methyltransferase
MRISGGEARGIPLVVPRGDAVRPATDGMRQAVFSSLGGVVAGASFLDLFAGSGAYGLEAVSRGAGAGVFVERDRKAASCLRLNIAAVCKSLKRNSADLKILEVDALSETALGTGTPDLVFIDPPYEVIPNIVEPLFERLSARFKQARGILVIFESPGELELAPKGWTCLKRLGRGVRQPTVSVFRPE